MQHLHYILARQQAVRITQSQMLLGREHLGHHHQTHVLMPAAPASCLVVRQTASALGIVEDAFDEVAESLHGNQLGQWGIGRGIAQAVLKFAYAELASNSVRLDVMILPY
ncbi:hypothetical protein [Chitinivorax sp. B]|uniref:hypothetical protein n=1 Tax=Chitinivorax sp. B TaxID=2502235 RepID=UPI0014858857|nr:hypothetical protein [Chitinivorax sp. B]